MRDIMAKIGYRILDSDMHIMEPPDLWERYTDSQFRHLAPQRLVTQVIEVVGNDNIIYSTNFPHVDAKFPHSADTILEMPLRDEDKRKILWDNCAAFYGANVGAMPT